MKEADRDPEDPTSRIEDIQTYDDVEVVDSNRAVIKTGSSSGDDWNYELDLTINADGETKHKTIRASTSTGLFRKFASWYANVMEDEKVLQSLEKL